MILFCYISCLAFATCSAPIWHKISIFFVEGMPSFAMCFSGIYRSNGIHFYKWMFIFCRQLQMFWIYTRTIMADMVQLFSFGYFAIPQFVTKPMGHSPNSISLNTFWSGKDNNASVSIRGDKSYPLPTSIMKNCVMFMEICNSILFLESRQARLAFMSFKYIVNTLCGTLKKQSQFRPVSSCLIFSYNLLFLFICKYSFHNNSIMGMGPI